MAGVEFTDVRYALREASSRQERLLLRGISLRIEAGTTTALLGRSGSGKTTLLRMVNGLVTPTAGTVRVDGVDTATAELVRLRRSIGYVIQETGLFPHMTVERNAGMTLELAGCSRNEIAAKAEAVLGMVGMPFAQFRSRYPWQLSGGQRQRVGLARALAGNPGVLLMDEPFGALDPLTRAEMQMMVRELFGRLKKTVLLVTHDLDEALYLASRVIFLADGCVVADLEAEEVLHSNIGAVQEYVRAVHRAIPS